MIETIRQLAGILGAATLIALPGNWIAFGLPVAAFGFWPRFACGVLLSPAVVFVQFSLLRWANVPFSAIAVILPILNAPALWLVLRSVGRFVMPNRKTIWSWAIALAAPAAFLAMWMHNPDVRANWGHAWLHVDFAYSIANGSVRPEEPLLAGIRLAYPWVADLFETLISFLLNVSPNSSYVWVDAAWLACTIGLVAHLIRQFGGNLLARTSSVIFLCFGLNTIGYISERVLPAWIVKQYPFWGDGRYTPWIRKFGVFAGTALGIALLAAVAVLVTRRWDGARLRSTWALITATMIALAISYPILFPAGALMVGGRLLIALLQRFRHGKDSGFSELLGPLTAVVLGALTTAIWLRVITVDRVSEPIVWRPLWSVKVQVLTAFVVLAPLLCGVALSAYGLLKRQMEAVLILLFTAAGCTAAYALFDIQYPTDEYKFIFPVGLCLAPFASIACANLIARAGRWSTPIFAAMMLVLVGPAFHDLFISWSYLNEGGPPRVEIADFNFGLKPGEPYAAVGAAIRTKSPVNSVLIAGPVTGRFNLDLVALTQRPLFVPYEGRQEIFGISMWADDLMKLTLGYDPVLIDRRRTVVHTLYETTQDQARSAQFAAIWSAVKRPLVVILDINRDTSLATWLAGQSGPNLLYSGEGQAAWLVTAPDEYDAANRPPLSPANSTDTRHLVGPGR